MPRRPDDIEPDPPGGRAAERLREFIEERFPGGLPTPPGMGDTPVDTNPGTARGEAPSGCTKEPEPPDAGDDGTP
jgi:hypothetical protein